MENKTAKTGRKWRLNIFDIVIIVIALAVAVLILASSRSGGGLIPSGAKETVLYTIELSNMQGNAAGLIKEGDQLVDKVEKRAIGTVVSATVEPFVKSERDGNTGDIRLQEVPGRQTAIIVVRAEATVTDSLISVDGFAIRAGAQISINGPMYHGNGYIIDVDRDGDYNANA